MSSVVDWLSSIAESIVQIPINIIEGIIDGIKAIFIPDTEEIKATFNTTLSNIKSNIGLNSDSVEDAFNSVTSQPVEDIKGNYRIPGLGLFNITFFSSHYFKVGIEYFRPVLRGFIVLMLFFYNYKQLLTFLGQDPGIFGRVVDTDHKKGGGKE